MGKWIGPRRCWYCGKQLQAKLGGGYHFATIKDPLNNELRTHKDCVKHAVGNGYVEVTRSEEMKGKP
jgi:hypothetical protein